MKKLVFLFAMLLVLSAGSVFAQQRGGGGRPGGGGQPPMGGPGGGQRPEGMPQQRPNDSGNRGQRPEGARQGGGENNGQRGQRPEGIRNGDLKGIGLSDAQKAQIKQIRKDAKENHTDPATVRQQIEGVLSPEQLEKLKQKRDKQKP